MTEDEFPEGTEPKGRRAPVLVYGEVLFDCFEGGERMLGGAPFNVAWGLQGMGRKPLLISAVGNDSAGAEVRQRMEGWGLETSGLQSIEGHATGEVRVAMHGGEPDYEICSSRAWDYIEDEGWIATEWIYHGTLALRSSENRESLRRLLRRSSAQRFLDLNLRSPHDALEALVGWLEGATWIKLNLDEFTRLAGEQTDFADAATVRQQADRLRARYGVANVLLTAGSQGARITGEAGEASFLPAPEPEPLRDTVGAGDAFSAFTINGLLTGAPLDELIAGASRFAAKVCGLRGATSDQTSFYETT